MQKITKHFAEQLNKCLDETGVPKNIRERTNVFSKMLHLPKQQAWSLLEGHLLPDEELLSRLSSEFEVDFQALFSNKQSSS